MRLPELEGKNIGIIGLGTNNRKLAEFLSAQGIKFGTIDQWTGNETLIGRLDDFDIIFRTPGLPYNSAAVQQAKNKGVIISSQTKLFFELCPAPIIGVTGTKGKGTTSSLIAKILESAGKKVWLAGNIGRDPFEFLEQIKPEDSVVLELSSFQLQDLERSPHIAVVLNITSDHLNHHADLAEYIQAKISIIAFQTPKDFAILHPALPPSFQAAGAGKKIIFDPSGASHYKTKLLGQHNWENIAAAAGAARVLEIPENVISTAIAEFEPLPHRLNPVKTVEGITYVDDGFSTNIDPTIAAMAAMDAPFVLIVGGFDKGLDWAPVGQAIKENANLKGVVVIGAVTEKILVTIKGFNRPVLRGAQTMEEMLKQARSLTAPGDKILFSPGTSSFDMFKNEYDRAEQFVQAVNSLKS